MPPPGAPLTGECFNCWASPPWAIRPGAWPSGYGSGVNADPRLGESDRELLVAVCRWLVQRGALETTELTSRGEDRDTECLPRELGGVGSYMTALPCFGDQVRALVRLLVPKLVPVPGLGNDQLPENKLGHEVSSAHSRHGQ
jgi:hypothetical protein